MAFDFLKSKKDAGKDSAAGSSAPGDTGYGNGIFVHDPRKARRFFEYGETMTQARNYDPAIDCYISGLRFDPDNLKRHQELRETALKRKAAGGKASGLLGVSKVGDSAVDKMLTAEKEWAMDPTNPKTLLAAIQAGLSAQAKADELPQAPVASDLTDSDVKLSNDTLELNEIIFWQAQLCLEVMAAAPKPDKRIYMELVAVFRKLFDHEDAACDKAIEACRRALQLDPDSSDMVSTLKNLEAEIYNRRHTGTKGKGGFRENLKDAEGQKMIQADITSAGVGIDDLIVKRRNEWMADRDNTDLIKRLVETLLKKEDANSEKEAVALLMKAYELTKEYGWKTRAADVQMQQYNRVANDLRKKMQADQNPETKAAYTKVRSKQVRFELDHYTERAAQYPTDMKVRFELGKRQYKAQMFDDAIASFQGAKNDPKSRAESSFFLGQCYGHKGWSDESIESFEAAMEEHQFEDDQLGKDIRYELMLALARSAKADNDIEKAEKAQRIASGLLQIDINYKDIREKMDTLRALTKKLKTGS